MNILPPKNRSKAQSFIEYTALIAVVIGAIIIMGPYVIRSWNAHLKQWDDSVQISHSDRLEQAPDDGFLNADCNCKMQAPCATPPCCGMGGCQGNQARLSIAGPQCVRYRDEIGASRGSKYQRYAIQEKGRGK